MRRILGLVLFGVAGFLVTAALLAGTYVPGAMKKTPLDTDSITRLSGYAEALPNGGPSPVKALSHTVANGELSDADVVVFDTFTCLVKDDGSVQDCTDDESDESLLVTASTDTFATDRRTGMAVQDAMYVSADSKHEGLVNKFPFDVEQKTYPFWDGVLGRAVDAVFQGEEELDGLNTYRFAIDVQDVPAEIADGVAGLYTSEKTMWIDPVTGAIIKQEEHQVRKFRGVPQLDLDFGFTDETVAANIESAKSSGSRLSMLGTAPWILGVLGLVALVAGALLFRGSSPRSEDSELESDQPPVADDTDYLDRTDQFFDEAETRRSRREATE